MPVTSPSAVAASSSRLGQGPGERGRVELCRLLRGKRRRHAGALGVISSRLPRPTTSTRAGVLRVQRRELLEPALGVRRPRRAGQRRRQLLALVEADRGQAGVDLGNLRLPDLDLHGRRVYALAHASRASLPLSSRPEPRPGINKSRERQSMPSTVILGTARTPFGKMGGTLSSLDATDLGGHVIEAALERSGVAPEQVQQVVFGQVLQAGQGQIPSRQAQIKGGIPKEVPSETVNKVCASGMRSLGDRRHGDPRRRHRGRRHRRHGVDEPGALPAARRPLRLPDGRRRRGRRDDPRRPHQPLQREADDQRGERGLQRAGDHPRRHGPLRGALPPARRRGDRRRPARRGDRRRHREVAQGGEHGRDRRGDPPRDDDRGRSPS